MGYYAQCPGPRPRHGGRWRGYQERDRTGGRVEGLVYFLGPDTRLPRPASCVKAHCLLHSWRNSRELGIWYQHGENAEHRFFVTALQTERRPHPVFAWLRRIHEYEAVGA